MLARKPSSGLHHLSSLLVEKHREKAGSCLPGTVWSCHLSTSLSICLALSTRVCVVRASEEPRLYEDHPSLSVCLNFLLFFFFSIRGQRSSRSENNKRALEHGWCRPFSVLVLVVGTLSSDLSEALTEPFSLLTRQRPECGNR